MKKRWLSLIILLGLYGVLFVLCRKSFDIGYVFDMYTFDWTARNILWICAAISAIPLFKDQFIRAYITFGGFLLGNILGELLGGFEVHSTPCSTHHGWWICIVTYLVVYILAWFYEYYGKKRTNHLK